MKHKAKVTENGQLIFFAPKIFYEYLLAFRGKHVDVIVKLPHKSRNLPQNARHWARMTAGAKALGDRTPEELHNDFRSYFLTDMTTTPPRVKSSTELTTAEFAEWEEGIDRVLAEMGIKLPEPEEE